MGGRDSGTPKFIKAPQELRSRAVNFEHGLELTLTDDLRLRIEAVIAASSDEFAREILEKLREMRQQVKAAEDDQLSRIFILSTIAELAFDVKGMGGTFGYPLLTQLAKSLQDFVARIGLPNEAQLEVISIHVDAMYVLLARGLPNPEDTAASLLKNLEIAVSKVQEQV